MASASPPYTVPSSSAPSRIELRKLPQAALVTIGLATFLNVGWFFVASAVGLLSPSVMMSGPNGPEPLTAGMVSVSTIVQMLVGVLVLAGLVRFRPRDAERLWPIIAGVALVLSFGMPLGAIPGAPIGYLLALDIMHVIAGGLAIWLLPTLARSR